MKDRDTKSQRYLITKTEIQGKIYSSYLTNILRVTDTYLDRKTHRGRLIHCKKDIHTEGDRYIDRERDIQRMSDTLLDILYILWLPNSYCLN